LKRTRVGQKTNYDKLTLEIWTNGSIGPKMALVEAAKILRKHLNPFVQYNELGSQVFRRESRRGRCSCRRRFGIETEHEPAELNSLGAGYELPGIGKY
jgi:DNA-directed RNA polymerase alpha subunit